MLNAILTIHIKATEELSPTMLHHIGKFTEYVACLVQTVEWLTTIRTLHKIHIFVEAQQNSSRVKKFFHQSEMTTLLRDCKMGLQQGLDAFQVSDQLGISATHEQM